MNTAGGVVESFSKMISSEGVDYERRCSDRQIKALLEVLGFSIGHPSFLDGAEKLLDRKHRRVDGKVSQKHNMLKEQAPKKGKEQLGGGGRYKGCNASNAGGDDHDEGHLYPDTCIGTWATHPFVLETYLKEELLDLGLEARSLAR